MSSGAEDTVTSVEEPSRALLICQACGKNGPPKTCSGCKVACFCDRNCQMSAWKAHRALCTEAKKYRLQQERNIEEAKQMLAEKRENTEIECAVCLDEKASSDSPFMKLECGHFFCYSCLFKCQVRSLETLSSGACPLCRQALPSLGSLIAERNYLFRQLARNASTNTERDEICTIAVEELESILDTYPGMIPALISLGETCTTMEQHDRAIVAYLKAYHAQEAVYSSMNNGSREELESAAKRQPSDAALEPHGISEGIAFAARFSATGCFDTVMSLSKAYVKCGNIQHAAKLAPVLEHLVNEKISDPTSDMNDTLKLAALKAEICLQLGEYQEAWQILNEHSDPSRFCTELTKVQALLLMKLGRFKEAAVIVGYLYHVAPPWDEDGKRQYLKLLNDINAEKDE